ncbi:hypothetical protein UA45_15220 [Morganella morganii]|uniref:Uncharacterized protein n=1 Tax=Morganella morganii TaxID=582 RepID=A0A0D8L787_MORMO|nr:hypothetical protein UA45_15220 [Morganella morganii]
MCRVIWRYIKLILNLTEIRVTEGNSDIAACKSTKIFCCRVFRRTRIVPSDFFGLKPDLSGFGRLQKTLIEVKMAEEESAYYTFNYV